MRCFFLCTALGYTPSSFAYSRSVLPSMSIPVEVSIYVSKSTPIKGPNEVIVNLQATNITIKERELVEMIVKSQLDNICSITLELVQKGIVLW